jgi:hypothetical protein
MSDAVEVLADDDETLGKLEALKETITEWSLSRKFEIYKEVAFLKSLDTSIQTLTEEASEEALSSAIEAVEALSGYSV